MKRAIVDWLELALNVGLRCALFGHDWCPRCFYRDQCSRCGLRRVP